MGLTKTIFGCRIIFVFILLLCVGTPLAFSGPLGNIKKVGHSQKQIARALQKETKAYVKLKRALINKELEIGSSKEDIQQSFGSPVVKVKRGNFWRHLYKPEYSTHFSGEKIYLYFDENGKLNRFQAVDFSG